MNLLGKLLEWIGKVTQTLFGVHDSQSRLPLELPESNSIEMKSVDEKSDEVELSAESHEPIIDVLPDQPNNEIVKASALGQAETEGKMTQEVKHQTSPATKPIRPLPNPKPRQLPPKPNKSFAQLVVEIRRLLGKYDDFLSAFELENTLKDALWYTDYVGELPIEREMFEILAKWLQRLFTREGKPLVQKVSPAIFVVSMVFSARYSDDDTRQFWHSYAHRVWGSEATPSFMSRCRARFEVAVKALEEVTHMDFPISPRVNVDFHVHRHALLPAYLQDDVARWLKKHLKNLVEFDAHQGVTNLLNAADIQYLPPRIRTFLHDDQTRDIAVSLLEQMVIAAQLFQDGESADAVAGLLLNPIERSLWGELSTTLVEQTPGKRSTRQPDIQWVWALAEDEWQLRIRNFVSETRPFEAVWHSKSTDGDKVIVDIQPWQRDDESWYVDELLLAGGPLDGEVTLYDPQDKKLVTLAVPKLPLGKFVAYRITQQRQFAIPVDTRLGLSNGHWLFSSKTGIKIQELKDGGQIIDPIQTDFYIPQSFREIAGHLQAALYLVDFPAVITVEGQDETIAKRSGTIGQPWLTGTDPISDLSASVPPAFTSSKVDLHFPELMDELLRFTLVIKANNHMLRHNLDELVYLFRKDGDSCSLNLAPLLESIVGTFTLDIQRGLRSVLVAPLQCTLLPAMTIVGPNPAHVYWKGDLPNAWVANIQRDQIHSENVQIKEEELGYRVIWDDLRQAEYRIWLHVGESQVVLAWKLQRHFAFLDKLGSDQTIAFENLKDATLTIYGLPDEPIVFNSHNKVFNAQIESRRVDSKLVMPFARHRIMDFIQEQTGENIPLEIKLGEHQWLIGTIIRDAPIKFSQSRPKPPQMQPELKIDSSSERVFKQKLGERIDLIHKPTEWIKRYGLLPAWAVASKKLLFRYAVPNYKYRIPITPETLAFEARTGYGHILLKLDGFHYERNFAKWEQNPRGGSDLCIKIPMQEPAPEDSFEQLIDYDLDGMWSAYQCTDCGEIFGNRLSSVATQRHKQLHAHGRVEAKRFHDLFYDAPLRGDILLEKWNVLDDPIIPYANYFDATWAQSCEDSLENIDYRRIPTHPLKIEAYQAATLQRLFQRAQNPTEYALLLENTALAHFQENIKKHMPSQSIPPMVSASLRLLNLISPSPNFDTQIMSLALWKRIQDVYSPLARQIEAKIGLEKQQTQSLIQMGTRICPDLLLWAFSWIELCYVHAKE